MSGDAAPPPAFLLGFRVETSEFAANSLRSGKFAASPPHPPSTHPTPTPLHFDWLAARLLVGRPSSARSQRICGKCANPHWLAARLLHPATQGRPPLLPPFRSPANSQQIRCEADLWQMPSSPSLHSPPTLLAGAPRHPGSPAPPPTNLLFFCVGFQRICGAKKADFAASPPPTLPPPTRPPLPPPPGAEGPVPESSEFAADLLLPVPGQVNWLGWVPLLRTSAHRNFGSYSGRLPRNSLVRSLTSL